MWQPFWIPFLIPTLIIKSNCDTNKTDSDVFIRYGGHAEADYQETTVAAKITTTTTTEIATTARKYTNSPSTTKVEEVTEDVLFVPNMTPDRRDEEDNDSQSIKIRDLMLMKSVNDVVNKNFNVEKTIDSPNEDILFISGKNYDLDKIKAENNGRRSRDRNTIEDPKQLTIPQPKLNCNDLDCNNTVKSICGTKFVDREWKFRLFLNDCYYRKVNCGFKYEINRYKQVELDKCKNNGVQNLERPFSYIPRPPPMTKPKDARELETRRSSSSRRSMTMNYNGEACDHPCPVTCPDDYDPQCSISSTGQRKVFLNHCKLDQNSCTYQIVWYKRPLSECVGGKKADMRQNRGFIGWMQRVGIVDRRGRLVLE